MKIINLVSFIRLKMVVDMRCLLAFLDRSMMHNFLEIYGVGDVKFAEVDEVVGTNELFDG